MKKLIRKIMMVLAILPLFLSLICTGQVKQVKADEVVHAYYRTQAMYKEVPNTFTISLKLEPGITQKGIIISTYASSSAKARNISLLINENGFLRLNWNSDEKLHVFEGKDFRTGNWEHITLVRDKENGKFVLYNNGEFVAEKTGGVGTDVIPSYRPAIGNDHRTSRVDGKAERYPFLGEIADIGIYSKALSAAEVKEEYAIVDKTTITKETNSSIVHNWVLEGEASKLVYSPTMPTTLKDWSGNGNDAFLCTVNHWYDAPKDEWYKANEDEYTFVFYPDIQETVDYQRSLIYKQNEWVRDHADDMNLAAVLTLGDLTNGIFSNWHTAYDAFKIFDNADVPYVLLLGNHDYDDQKNTLEGERFTGHFNEFFEYEKYASEDWFVEAKEEGKLDNACYTFSGAGVNYLVFALEFGPSDSTLEWASSILDRPEYADYRAIVLTHSLVTRNGRFTSAADGNGASTYGFAKAEGASVNDGDVVWEKLLSKHDNVFMAAGGHTTSDTIMRRFDTGDYGNQVLSMLIDGQAVSDVNNVRGSTLILVCKINEKTKKMSFNYYDPVNDLYFCVENDFEYDFADWLSKDINASEGINVKEYAKHGELVEFSVTPDASTTKYGVVATDKKGNKIDVSNNNGNYSLVMPSEAVNINLVQIDETKVSLPSNIELSRIDKLDLQSYLPSGYDYKYSENDVLKVENNILTPKKAGNAKLQVILDGIGLLKEINVNVLEHTCIFDKTVTSEEYFAHSKTCAHGDAYYYSCVCGEKGSEVFHVGENGAHVFNQKVVDDKYLATSATCSSAPAYYYSCVCGEKGVATFTDGEALGHTYADDCTCHDQECLNCDHVKEGSGNHNFGEGVVTKEATVSENGTREYTCDDCGAKLVEIIPMIKTSNSTVIPTLSFIFMVIISFIKLSTVLLKIK